VISPAPAKSGRERPEHLDVLIVGAGLSGVGAAWHLQDRCPGRSYAILEARDDLGGTWDLFRYPGIRSDSDMHTLGYRFRPWVTGESIASGDSILEYVRGAAREHGIDARIRYGHRVVHAEWSSEASRWTVEAELSGTGETVRLTCGFLWSCSGYYRYDEGYTPRFDGVDRFAGDVVHPQHWPEGLDYAGKRVVVVGSGATAVTLVPAMAEKAAHVTMLQRSPSYVAPLPAEDRIARVLRRILPERRAYAIVRWKNILIQTGFFQLSRRRPEVAKRLIRRRVERLLPPGYPIDVHFHPRYEPWDQRLCLAPDGDLFAAISAGRVSVLTDRIATFTETGLELESGDQLEADVIVTATGLNLCFLGGIELTVDGEQPRISHTLAYKGMMLSGVPNFAFSFGYLNASWTLRSDLTAEYVCRLLDHMEEHGYDRCVPRPDSSVRRQAFPGLKSGYVLRSIRKFPKQGSAEPWRVRQNYPLDRRYLRRSAIDDGTMRFSRAVDRASSRDAERAFAGEGV
jgi:monooxygenase